MAVGCGIQKIKMRLVAVAPPLVVGWESGCMRPTAVMKRKSVLRRLLAVVLASLAAILARDGEVGDARAREEMN